jgi:predicted metal-dependent peptidase
VRQGEIVKRQRSKDGAGSQDGVFGALLEAKINWREVLRDFVSELCAGKDESSWRKPNRRYLSDDVYMPTLQGVTMGELVVALDTSGSCFGSAMMTAFVSELQGVIEQVRPSRVRVLYWDTRVAGDQVFDDGHFAVATLKPKGGGGTRADVVFDYLRDNRIKPEAVIVLTDGEIGNSWGKSDWPTLWAIAGKRKAPFGTTIRVEV